MLSVFLYALHAVLPILLLVLLGYLLKCSGLFTKEWLRIANRFNFHYPLSALMFCNVYALDDLDSIDWSLAGFILVSLFILTAVGFLLAKIVTGDPRQKGVLIQAAFRSNYAVIGLPLGEALAVPDSMGLLSAMQAPAIIYFNFMSVLALSLYTKDQKVNFKKLIRNILTNPLIRGLVLGLGALALRSVIPKNPDGSLVFSLSGSLPSLYQALVNLSKIATPLALIVQGGQFEFRAARGVGRPLVCGTAARLILAPILGFSMTFTAARLGLITMTPAVLATLLPLYSSPIAVSSSVMAAEMGADDVLAGQLVVWTTVFSMFTLFLQIAAFRAAGLI